jgi:hypothetical protein
VYVGAVQNTDALVAVADDGVDWVAYVCGGATTYATMTAWFSSHMERDAGEARLSASSGAKEFTAAVHGELATGTIVVDGTTFEFSAQLSGGKNEAGLFSVVDEGCRTGLVVPPASLGEAQGVWCSAPGRFQRNGPPLFAQVTPIRPWSMANRAILVSVSPPGVGARQLSLTPVALPLD